MDLVFLAAGFATRLEPLTLNTPKHLLPLKKGVFFDLLINQLEPVQGEFGRKLLITNDKYFEKFIAWQNSAEFEIEIYKDGVKDKSERLGAVGDLLSLLDQADLESDLLILASDYILKDFDFESFLKFAKSKDASATIAKIEENEEALKSGSCLELNQEDMITKFEEKPTKPFSNLYGAPYYFIKKDDLKLIKSIPKELHDNCGQFVAKLLKDSKIYGYRFEGEDLHMTTIKDYESIKKQYED